MRVLIVEDDRTAADFLAKALGEAGYQTEIAGDGETGYELASGSGYGVLIVDRMLPKLDGTRWRVTRSRVWSRVASDWEPIASL